MTSPATPAGREKARRENAQAVAETIAEFMDRFDLSDDAQSALTFSVRVQVTAALADEREAAIAECREFLAVNGHKQALADMERQLGGEG